MQNLYQVAIHYERDFGRIEYNLATKEITVVLDHAAKRREVEQYLSEPHTLPQDWQNLLKCNRTTAYPHESLEAFKLALTRMWESTGVLVDWSRPADDFFRV